MSSLVSAHAIGIVARAPRAPKCSEFASKLAERVPDPSRAVGTRQPELVCRVLSRYRAEKYRTNVAKASAARADMRAAGRDPAHGGAAAQR
jgi:hypothetical protein